MVDWQTLTWADLAPLYNDTWKGPDALQALLGDLFPQMVRICRSALADERQTDHSSAVELASATFVHVVEKLTEKQGRNRPSEWQLRSPRAVFSNWVKSRARDRLRNGRTLKDRTLGETPDGPSSEEQLATLVQQSTMMPGRRPVDQELEVRERLNQVLSVLDQQDLPGSGHRLACLCLRAPERVERWHVDAAVEESTAEAGLARTADQTWALLLAWRARVTEPDGRASRVELAWIFFSQDTTTPQQWKRDHAAAEKDARDLLRKWDARFRRSLRTALAQQEEGA